MLVAEELLLRAAVASEHERLTDRADPAPVQLVPGLEARLWIG